MDLQNYDFGTKTYNGQVKWFNDKNGYGFITMIDEGDFKGHNLFVHHTSITPKVSEYKSLTKGEYVSFNVSKNDVGPQASNVTGYNGGLLMIDVNNKQVRKEVSKDAADEGFKKVLKKPYTKKE
jgi:CspA family cold shock protein